MKVGTTVRVTQTEDPEYFMGLTGTVVEYREMVPFPVYVQFENGKVAPFSTREVEEVE